MEDRDIPDIESLVALASLREVRVYEFSAKVTGPAQDELGEPEFSLEYFHRDEPGVLEDRFRFGVRTADAEYLTDLAAIHALDEPVRIDKSIRVDFARRIAFMVAFPFIREALVASAGRLGRKGPLLDLVRPGDIEIHLQEDEPGEAVE